jgi:hypothetical protein
MKEGSQMRKLFLVSSQAKCVAIGVLLVLLTAIFVLVPYGMERHPWESGGMASAALARAS